jgi:hypothetical protein
LSYGVIPRTSQGTKFVWWDRNARFINLSRKSLGAHVAYTGLITLWVGAIAIYYKNSNPSSFSGATLNINKNKKFKTQLNSISFKNNNSPQKSLP